jgi:hypothetical protein
VKELIASDVGNCARSFDGFVSLLLLGQGVLLWDAKDTRSFSICPGRDAGWLGS